MLKFILSYYIEKILGLQSAEIKQMEEPEEKKKL